jgi:hypothetical protein
MRNCIFHQVTIAGLAFDGIISADGPYLSCRKGGGVALGVSGIRQFRPGSGSTHRDPQFGWWVVKYRDEERIFLPGFDRASIRKLSEEFGLLLLDNRAAFEWSDRVRSEYFFTSPAWEALRWWVIKHPRIAKAHAVYDPYLPSWYERAIAESEALSA